MPDRKLKTKRDEREKDKLREQGKLEDAATKNEGIKRTDTGSQDASLRKQLDLFHFYKKKVYGPGSRNRTHTTEIVRADTDLQASVNAYINPTVDETLSNGDDSGMGPSLVKTVIDNDMGSFNTQSDTRAGLIIPSNVMLNESANALSKTSNANASDTVMTQRGMDWSTDVNSTIQEQHNTSTVYLNTSSEPKDQDIPTQCAASSQLSPLSSHTPQLSHSTFPLDGPALTPHLSQSNIFLTTDPVSFSGHDMPSLITNQLNGRKHITSAEDASNKSEIRYGSSRNLGIESRIPNDERFWEEATLEDSDSHYYTAMMKPLLSSASSAPTSGARQVIEQASEHEGEKEFKRRDHLRAEEASESICSALQNVNGNGPGAEDIDAINRSMPTPDRLSEEDKSITVPICLTASPRPELGPPAGIATPPLNRPEFISFSQGNPFPNEICTNEAANRGKFSSPASGSREKPIEVLSPVSLAQLQSPSRAHFWPSSSKVLRESGENTYQIHPFFQRTTNATTPVPTINPNRGTDGDSVGLGLNFKFASFSSHSSQNSGTTKHATFRAHIPKGKRNKDKLGDEAQCDITNESGNEDADVIFSRITGKKKQTRDTNDISLTTSVLVPLRVLAPWPNNENQHVMKSPRLAVKPPAFRERIRKVKKVDETKVEGSLIERLNCKYTLFKKEAPLVQSLSQMTSSSIVRRALATIPNEHGNHPGIARVISVIENIRREGRMAENAETLPLHSTWTTKWKPGRAAEVLGNESEALYLREWLKALSIRDRKCSTPEKAKDKEKENIKIKKHKRKRKEEEQGQVRRVVIRSIAKRKRRRIESDEDDDGDKSWIVSDEGEEIYGNVSGDADDWLSDAGKPQENDLSNDQKILEKEFSKRLTNTIVIAGKPGTGKTSAVYACAVELGWEIFEVYPGIGKRAGANVVELVGNVGKNHIVGKGVRQSIILLEEVDILFKEDVNFWTSVVNIISTSHRPVILTCNDASLIPQDLLPLQTCLEFEACPCGLASSFLQAVCIAEGFDVTRKRVEEEYALIGGDEPEWPPSVAFPSEALPSADLRSALNRLQMGLQFPASQEEYSGNCIRWTVEEHALKDCELYAETASYVDAYLNPIKQKPEFETQGDDEIGYTMLTKLEECPFKDMQKTDFNNYSMACDALAYCRHVVNVSSTKCEDTQPQSASEPASESEHRWLIQTRRLLARQAASFLDEIISLPGPLLPHHEAVLEYVPAVQWLVSLDDAQDKPSHSRRRWRHVRYMALSEQALSAAREYYDMFFPRCIT